MADCLWAHSRLQGNAYNQRIFPPDTSLPKDRDLVFLGRLVSDKGADLLISALARLDRLGLRPRLTIVGDGPERSALNAQAERLGVASQVEFAGVVQGVDLAALLRRHEIMVVPSRWPEPFGIMALEGMACGCVPVVSDGGGLPFAVGRGGVAFARNSETSLAETLAMLLRSPSALVTLRREAPAHLDRFRGERVAAETLAKLADGGVGSLL